MVGVRRQWTSDISVLFREFKVDGVEQVLHARLDVGARPQPGAAVRLQDAHLRTNEKARCGAHARARQ